MEIIDLCNAPQYIPFLAEWHHKEWSYINPDETLDDRIQRMQQHLSDQFIPSTFVALENDTVLGSAAIIQHDMETHMQLSPWLASVYVINEGSSGKLVGEK